MRFWNRILAGRTGRIAREQSIKEFFERRKVKEYNRYQSDDENPQPTEPPVHREYDESPTEDDDDENALSDESSLQWEDDESPTEDEDDESLW